MARDGGSDEVAPDLWAMAAELERQFAGYKQRLAERNARIAHADDDAAAAVAACDDDASGGGEVEEVDDNDASGGGDVRGRMYEAYVRRRDERLRQGWRARMERKEAEVKAFWAQLELTGRASGERAPAGADPTADGAGDEEVRPFLSRAKLHGPCLFVCGCCLDTLIAVSLVFLLKHKVVFNGFILF